MDMAEGSDYSSVKRERSRSPIDDDSRDREGGNDHDGERDRGRRMDRGRRNDRSRGGGRRGSEDTRIYVSNIPYEYKWQDLKDLFRKEVGEVAYVEMFNDENNRPRGCAVIEFESMDLVAKAVKSMHRFELKGRKLVVKEKADDLPLAYLSQIRMGNRMGGPSRQDFDSDRDRRMMKSDMRSRDFARGADIGGPPSMSVNKFGNTFGLSTVFLESLGITGPLVSKVFVANLDYKVDDKMLKDVFKIAGKVLTVEISKDQDGKSRGFGVVEFEHPVEAVQAISMFHNQTYYDRKISVRMDRVTEKQESTATKLPPGLKSLGMGLGVNGTALTDVANNVPSFNPSNSGGLPNAVATGVSASLPGMGSMTSNMGTMGNQNMGMMGMGGTTGMGTGMANLGTGMGNLGNMGTGLSSLGNMGTGMGNMGAGMNTMGNGMGSSIMGSMGTSSSMVSNLTGVGAGLAGGGGLVGSSLSRGSLGSSGGGGYSSYGSSSLSREYNHASGTNNSSSSYSGYRNIIQLSHLPLDYTWQSLRDLCREFGEIRFAEIRSKGTGTVRFQTESDARRAVEMLDRQRLDGRILDVVLL